MDLRSLELPPLKQNVRAVPSEMKKIWEIIWNVGFLDAALQRALDPVEDGTNSNASFHRALQPYSCS